MKTPKTFILKNGVVVISKPHKQYPDGSNQAVMHVELKYVPNDLDGWGITKDIPAFKAEAFTKTDAENFAASSELRLRDAA